MECARIIPTPFPTPSPRPWKNFLPQNQSLVPKRLGTVALDGLILYRFVLPFLWPLHAIWEKSNSGRSELNKLFCWGDTVGWGSAPELDDLTAFTPHPRPPSYHDTACSASTNDWKL